MGERVRRRKKFFSLNPVCCFCGFSAEEEDHVPPRVFFADKLRPNDFVFPACRECNRKSSISDVIASFFFRMGSSLSHEVSSDDMRRFALSLSRNIDVYKEMHLDPSTCRQIERQVARKMGGYKVSVVTLGPIIRCHLTNFLSKFAAAFYYRRTGSVFPSGGLISSFISPNADIIDPELPRFDFDFSQYDVLRQGTHWTVDDQISIRFALSTDCHAMAVALLLHQTSLCIIFMDATGQLPWVVGADEGVRRMPNLILEPSSGHLAWSTGPLHLNRSLA